MANVSKVTAQLKVIWEALTPPTEPLLVYNQLPSQVISTAGAVQRQFWFQLPPDAQIALLQDYSYGPSVCETNIEAILRLSVIGKAPDVIVAQATDEAVLLARAANLFDWSTVAGVDEVEIALTTVRPGPFGTLDVSFRIRVRTQET